MALAAPREGESLDFHVYPTVMDEGTLGDPEAIIWSSIRHLCSRGVAEDVAAPAHGITRQRDRRAVGRNLKLYIQQASEFYEAAHAAKANTAPLIYYYSFLNLAKALSELHHPRFHERSECYKHGISWRPDPQNLADPSKDTVTLTTKGVWQALWESLMQRPCSAANPTKLRIKDLFSFCPEISVESAQTLGTQLKLLDMEAPKVVYDTKSSESWLRFSVYRFDLRLLSVSAPRLVAQISTARSTYIEVKSVDRQHRTFQSSIAKAVGRGETALGALQKDLLGLNVFTHMGRASKLQYFLPVQTRLPLHVPQLLVSYTILFWLGSLVRYDPHSVSALMDSGHWMLIDGFMSQSRLWLLELFEWAFYKAETTLWLSR